MSDDGMAFVNGQIEPTIDFDWDLVEPEKRSDVEQEIRRECARALAKLSAQLLTVGGRNHRQFFLAANCLAFANHIHPDQSSSGEKIARSIGMKKAAFFKRVNQWRDILKLPRLAGAWCSDARKSIKTATKKSHEKRQKEKLKSRRGPVRTFASRLAEINP